MIRHPSFRTNGFWHSTFGEWVPQANDHRRYDLPPLPPDFIWVDCELDSPLKVIRSLDLIGPSPFIEP